MNIFKIQDLTPFLSVMKKSSMNIKLRKQCLGMGLIGWIVAIPAALIGLIVIAFIICEVNKAYWDHKVSKMCEKDGGITVYDKEIISQKKYRQLGSIQGEVTIPFVDKADMGDDYVRKFILTNLRKGFLKVNRHEMSIIRRADNKVLGRRISYSRIAGDFPTIIAHHSSFSCPEHSSLVKQIFIIEGEQ